MKAEEIKAKELVNKFKTHPLISQGEAVRFAIICVEEIIHYLEIVLGVDKTDFEFWQEVLTILKAM